MDMWFDLDSVGQYTNSRFADNEGAIFLVKLNEHDPEDSAMHMILLAGHFKEGGVIRSVAVGDSLLDDVQIVLATKISDRLRRTLDWAGALFSYNVSVVEV